MFISPKVLFIFSRGFKILVNTRPVMMIVMYSSLVVKKEMLLNVPQAQIGSIAPLNCFKHPVMNPLLYTYLEDKS